METKVTEDVGRSVKVDNAESWWFLNRGRVLGTDQYGLLYVDLGGGEIKPFHPSEISFTTIKGES